MRYDGKLAGDPRQTNRCTGTERHPCKREARYCPLCGSETFFSRKGLLKHWQASLQKYDKPEARLTIEEFTKI